MHEVSKRKRSGSCIACASLCGLLFLRVLPAVALHLPIRAPVLGRIESPIYCYFGPLQIQNENGVDTDDNGLSKAEKGFRHTANEISPDLPSFFDLLVSFDSSELFTKTFLAPS